MCVCFPTFQNTLSNEFLCKTEVGGFLLNDKLLHIKRDCNTNDNGDQTDHGNNITPLEKKRIKDETREWFSFSLVS